YICPCIYLLCLPSPLSLHSFPTRRSSDLPRLRPHGRLHGGDFTGDGAGDARCAARSLGRSRRAAVARTRSAKRASLRGQPGPPRSEEHTSELQSRGHLVCRLLLEKKNNAI